MVKLINQDFESFELKTLLDNQADDGASKQMQRVLEDEKQREEVLKEMRVDDLPPVVPTEEVKDSDDEVSGASILSLIERDLDEDEIAAAVEKSLTSMAGNIAKDRASIKRKLEDLQELLAVLEVKSRRNGIEPHKIVHLRDVQLQIGRLRNNVDNPSVGIQQVQALLKSAEFAKLVTVGIKQAQIAATLPVEVKPHASQAAINPQAILRESFAITQQAYKAVKAEALAQSNPQTRAALQELSRQATAITTTAQCIKRESSQIQILQKVADVLQQNTQVLPVITKMVNAPAQQSLNELLRSNKDAIQEVTKQVQRVQAQQVNGVTKPTQEVTKKDNVIPLTVKEAPKAQEKATVNVVPIKKDNVVQLQPKQREELKPIAIAPPRIQKIEIPERMPLGKVDAVSNTAHPAGCNCPACVGAAKTENRDAKMAPATTIAAVERTRAPLGRSDTVSNSAHPAGCNCPACVGAAGVSDQRASMQASNAAMPRQRAPQPTATPTQVAMQEPLKQQTQANQI